LACFRSRSSSAGVNSVFAVGVVADSVVECVRVASVMAAVSSASPDDDEKAAISSLCVASSFFNLASYSDSTLRMKLMVALLRLMLDQSFSRLN